MRRKRQDDTANQVSRRVLSRVRTSIFALPLQIVVMKTSAILIALFAVFGADAFSPRTCRNSLPSGFAADPPLTICRTQLDITNTFSRVFVF
jgi:hypothetical protein